MSAAHPAEHGTPDQVRFLEKLRKKLPLNEPTPHPGRWRASRSDDSTRSTEILIERFSTELAAVGGHAARCDSVEALRARLTSLVAELGIRTVVLDQDPRWLERPFTAFHRAIEASGPIVITDGAVDAVSRADAGITLVDRAIAETGTVAVKTGPGRSRLTSLLPPIHIALLPAGLIRETRAEVLDELGDESKKAGWPAQIVLITGPSRTADIESDLSIGVHGPGHVYVIIV